MRFINPANNHIEDKSTAWLWTLLFGPFYLMSNGLWIAALSWFAIAVLLLASMGPPAVLLLLVVLVVYAALAPGMVKTAYLRKGWKVVEENSAIASTDKKCHACAEIIKAEAKICRFCNQAQPEIVTIPEELDREALMDRYSIYYEREMYTIGIFDFDTLEEAVAHAKTLDVLPPKRKLQPTQ
jgi:hypothetical protein